MRNLDFDPQVVESERGVVYSERRSSVDNDNFGVLQEQMQATAFVAHPYQFPIIGWPSDIEGWTIEDLRTYYQRYYAPNNAVMLVVGDVSPSEVFALAEKHLASIKAQPAPEPVTTREPPQLGERRLTVVREAQTPLLAMAWHAAAAPDRQTRVMEVLLAVLGGGDSSRLHQKLVEQEQAALQVGTSLDQGFDPGLAWIYAVIPPGGDTARAEKLIDAELARISRDGPTPAELAKARNQALAGVLARPRDHQRQGAGARDLRGLPRRLPQALRCAGCLRGNHRGGRARSGGDCAYGRESNGRRAGAGGLRGGAGRAGRAGRGAAMTRLRLAAGVAVFVGLITPALAQDAASRGVKLGPYERHTLANGAVLVLMEKHDTPLVSLSAVLRGGSLGDPPGKEGSAALLAELIQKGAGRRDAAAYAEAIESVGGELVATSGTESLGIGASFLARDVDLMVELVADALLRPKLDPQEFAKVRTLAIQSIAAAKDADPRELIDTYGDAWLFRGHPYGRPVEGSESSLESVSLEDVKGYYASQLGGDRLIVTVVGDIRAGDMKRRLETAFSGWRKAGAAAPAAQAPARAQGSARAARRQARCDADLLLAGQRRCEPHRSGARGADAGQHAVRRPVYVDAQHGAADQERAQLRRVVGLHAVEPAGSVSHHFVRADRQDGRSHRPRARDARSAARRRPRR